MEEEEALTSALTWLRLDLTPKQKSCLGLFFVCMSKYGIGVNFHPLDDAKEALISNAIKMPAFFSKPRAKFKDGFMQICG